jgi:hypothetical protein
MCRDVLYILKFFSTMIDANTTFLLQIWDQNLIILNDRRIKEKAGFSDLFFYL